MRLLDACVWICSGFICFPSMFLHNTRIELFGLLEANLSRTQIEAGTKKWRRWLLQLLRAIWIVLSGHIYRKRYTKYVSAATEWNASKLCTTLTRSNRSEWIHSNCFLILLFLSPMNNHISRLLKYHTVICCHRINCVIIF